MTAFTLKEGLQVPITINCFHLIHKAFTTQKC